MERVRTSNPEKEVTSNVKAVDVAAYILERKGTPIEQLKLQKLLYYCQALNLVRHGRVLFDDPIEAWVNGPVVRTIWDRHPYEYLIREEPTGRSAALSLDDKSVVDAVLRTYDKYPAWQLVRFVHNDAPWQEARRGLRPHEIGSREIRPERIREFYSDRWQ